MKRSWKLFLRFAFVLTFLLPFIAHANENGLTLRRVVMSTGGVGYFEYEAMIRDDETLTLTIPYAQVNDIMKSLVVFDAEGSVKNIYMAGQNADGELLQSLPFDPYALGSLPDLLNALKGKEVKIRTPRRVSGKIVAVEPIYMPEQNAANYMLTLVNDDGLQRINLAEVEEIDLRDEQLNHALQQALTAFAANRSRQQREIRIDMTGKGSRLVKIGYVAPTPLWKTSYRLTLTQATQGQLQGWAIFENMSGQDWHDVSLSLISGNPVTLTQQLYPSYYRDRPEIPLEVTGQILPRPDTGVMTRPQMMQAEDDAMLRSKALGRTGNMAMMMAAPAPRQEMAQEMAYDMAAIPNATPGVNISDQGQGEQIAFTLKTPVSVPAGSSVMIPLLTEDVPANMIQLYQPDRASDHPFITVEVLNTTGHSLPSGILTLYQWDQNTKRIDYIGDAQFNHLPKGEERLLSFALDHRIQIARDIKRQQNVSEVKIQNGVIAMKSVEREEMTFRISGQTNRDQLILELPLRYGWSLITPPEGNTEKTKTHYRLPFEGQDQMTVILGRPLKEQLTIGALDQVKLKALAEATELPQATKQFFMQLAGLQNQIAQLEEQKRLKAEERDRIFGDQQRLRENMAQLDKTGTLYKTYLNKLAAQEEQIGSLDQQMTLLTHEITKLQDDLGEMIRKGENNL